MTNKTLLLILTLSLLTGILLVGCGTESTPMPAALPATQNVDQQPAPAIEAPTEPAPTEAPTEVVPTEAPTEAPAATVSFTNDVLPILESRCVNCHGGDRIEEGLLLRSYDEVMAGSQNGVVVVPGDTANSLMVELVTNQKMPKRGPKLTPPQVQAITEWVASGAPNN